MSKFKVGDKAIIWSKKSPHLNGTIVTLAKRLDRSISGECRAWCRVNQKYIQFKMSGEFSWKTEELFTKKGLYLDTVELIWSELALRPYDPPSEHTPESLIKSLNNTILGSNHV